MKKKKVLDIMKVRGTKIEQTCSRKRGGGLNERAKKKGKINEGDRKGGLTPTLGTITLFFSRGHTEALLRQSSSCFTGQVIAIAQKDRSQSRLNGRRQHVLEMFALNRQTLIVLVVSGHFLSSVHVI